MRKKKEDSKFLKYYNFNYKYFLEKYWLYILLLLFLVYLFYIDFLEFNLGTAMVVSSIVLFFLVYFESAYLFKSPESKVYVQPKVKISYKIISYILIILLFVFGLVIALASYR